MANKIAFNIKGRWVENLTGAGLIAMEKLSAGEPLSFGEKQEFMACFMADASGKLLDPKKALEILRHETRQPVLVAEYQKLVEALTDKAVPPENGKPSEKPEKAPEASPAGQ